MNEQLKQDLPASPMPAVVKAKEEKTLQSNRATLANKLPKRRRFCYLPIRCLGFPHSTWILVLRSSRAMPASYTPYPLSSWLGRVLSSAPSKNVHASQEDLRCLVSTGDREASNSPGEEAAEVPWRLRGKRAAVEAIRRTRRGKPLRWNRETGSPVVCFFLWVVWTGLVLEGSLVTIGLDFSSGPS